MSCRPPTAPASPSAPPTPTSTLLDSEARAPPMLVRASPHYYNIESEVDRLIELCTALSATPAAR